MVHPDKSIRGPRDIIDFKDCTEAELTTNLLRVQRLLESDQPYGVVMSIRAMTVGS